MYALNALKPPQATTISCWSRHGFVRKVQALAALDDEP